MLGGYDIFKEAKVRQFWARNPASAWRPALLKRLYPYLDLTSAQSAAYLREFFGVGLDRPRGSVLLAPAALGDHRAVQAVPVRGPAPPDRWLGGRALPGRAAGRTSTAGTPSTAAEYVEARTLLPSYLLSSQGDRMLMANSVEGRFPFLDHRLIAFANALHPRHKMRVLREKHLLRETMRTDLPPVDRCSGPSSRTGRPTPPPSCRAARPIM